ncbi:MAG: pitrilysin family protein [Ignavibacteriales bacterium]|nr:pitrilysin family protein [Ignavibacteriales bacterium]
MNQHKKLKTIRQAVLPSFTHKTEATYQKTVLDNGVRIVTEEIPHVRSLSLGFWIETGSRDEFPANNGISHFIEHMVFKGTKKRSVKEIAQSIESVGGYLNAFTSKEHTCYYARVLDEHLELATDVLSDMVFQPTFPQKEFEKEKNVILEELKQAEDDPDDIIQDYFEKALFKTHPLGMPVIGNAKSITSFTRKDLLHYKTEQYTSANLVVAAAGNLQHAEVVELTKRYLQNAVNSTNKRSERNQSVFEEPSSVLSEYYKPIQQAHICLGTIGFHVHDERRFPMQVLNTLLGDGMSSRLFQNIREKYGFAYAVYSFNNMMQDTGAAGVYIGTDNSHVQRCIDLVWKELKSLRTKGITKEELTRTKAQLKGSMMLGMENIPNRMIRLGSSELYFGELISLDTIIHKIDAVTREEVQEIAEGLFKEDRFATVIFHPNGNHETTTK